MFQPLETSIDGLRERPRQWTGRRRSPGKKGKSSKRSWETKGTSNTLIKVSNYSWLQSNEILISRPERIHKQQHQTMQCITFIHFPLSSLQWYRKKMKDLMRITFSRVKGNSCGRLTTIFIPGKHLLHLLLSSAHIFSWLFLNFNILDQQYLSKSYLKWLYLRRRPISYIIPLKSSATVAADTLCECRSRTKVRPWKVEH